MRDIPTHLLHFHSRRHRGGYDYVPHPPTGQLQVRDFAMYCQLLGQPMYMLSVKLSPMPFQPARGSLGFAYTRLHSKYLTRPGTVRVFAHSSFLRRRSHPWVALLQGAFVCAN